MGESEDLRGFIREIMGRLDRHMDAADRRFEALLAQQREDHARHDGKLDEIVAEGRAGRAALFAIIGKLNNSGPAAAG